LFALSEQDMMASHYHAALEKVSAAKKFFEEQNMGREIYYTDLYLSRIYEALGNYEMASRHYYTATAINDSLQNEEVTTKISEWEVLYETDKKNNELKIKQQENTLLQSQNENALLTRNITLVIAFFILLTSCLLYLRFKIKSRYLGEKAKRKDIELRHAEAEIAYLVEHEKVIEMEFLKLNQELDTNRKALVLKSFELQQKKGALEHVEKGIDELRHEGNRANLKEQLEIIKTGLKNVKAIEDDWERVETYFKGIDPNFFASLKTKNTKLTTNELKLCAFIKMGFSTKEIATQLNTTTKAAEISKYRLKKKLGLDKDQSLLEFILTL
jgi:DNA-binding CsgD family transcriptional regulator